MRDENGTDTPAAMTELCAPISANLGTVSFDARAFLGKVAFDTLLLLADVRTADCMLDIDEPPPKSSFAATPGFYPLSYRQYYLLCAMIFRQDFMPYQFFLGWVDLISAFATRLLYFN